MLSDAFAGFAKSLTGEGPTPQTPHGKFIHDQVLPLTTKLQREVRGRRTKDAYTKIQEAILALRSFQHEDWLLQKNSLSPPASTMMTKKESDGNLDDDVDDDDDDLTIDSSFAGTEITADSTTDSPDAATTQHRPSLLAEKLQHITDDDQSVVHPPEVELEDDPQTREPVHAAVTTLAETCMLVLTHASTTPKACEYALDVVHMLLAKRYLSGRAGGQSIAQPPPQQRAATTAPTDDAMSDDGVNKDDLPKEPETSLLHRLMESIAKASEINNENVHLAVVRAFKDIVTSPKCGVHEASMLLALRSTFHVYLVSKSQPCKDAAKAALLDMMRCVLTRMEVFEAVHKQRATPPPLPPHVTLHNSTKNDASNSDAATATAPLASQYHTDAYVLFRALCKLSSKELPADNDSEPDRTRLFINSQIPTDPLALSSKILSLKLILAAMDFCGTAFTQGEKFVHLVQHYLCVSLLKNCMSNQTQVAFLSQKIFLVLVYKFKGHLKQEIEVFLSNIFLRVLDSPNSSFKQKALVLESLRSLCSDPVLLTQIFLNYDCDLNAVNLYKEIVHMLTKLSGTAVMAPPVAGGLIKSESQKAAEQELELSLAGLEVLVSILTAMLRALGLPADTDASGYAGSDGGGTNDVAGARIRGMLHLDVGMGSTKTGSTHGGKVDGASTPMMAMTTSDAGASSADETSLADGRDSPSGGGEEGATSSDMAGKIVDAFEMKRNAEQNFEIGAVKFTLSLKGGLNFFIENGFVQCDAREVALFFLANKDKLDKTQMGEALGREVDAPLVKEKGLDPEKGGPGFWVRILHHYADALDFTGMMFDEAIRLFLSGFRLPGEAQKIDRIMEKFAEKFTSQNAEVFGSPDTAFILAFSVIMLNTDLHNPSIKPERRMTIESFVRNNKGIGENGTDLPYDFLLGIFTRIKERPFSLKEDDAAREREQKQTFDAAAFFDGSNLFGVTAEQRKRETFKKEKDELMAVTEQLMRRRPEKNAKLVDPSARLKDAIAPADVVKPMFDGTWGPLLGILSQVLECSDDIGCVTVCLNGFAYAVRIASHSRMSLARDTFVSSLAKFTFLGSIKEMKRKNVESVRTLLSIAVVDGEFLAESWGPVLQCISQLARLRLTASGLDSDESFLGAAKSKRNVVAQERRMDIFARPPSRGEVARETEESNGRAVLEAVQEVLIDKVFSSTVNLSAKSLARFIEQLIAVSESEVAGTSKSGITGVDGPASNGSSHGVEGPSIYSLQRLVDVADFNMDVRPRLVWAQVWERMADFFAKIACHSNAMVSVFAIDSLKQLSLKFLDKPELSEFNFQRIFLKPFLIVMEDKRSREDVRELVLQCVDNIIRTKSANLRSGWKVVYSILEKSASDPSEKIDFLGLNILQRLLDDHMNDLCSFSSETGDGDDPQELTPLQRRYRNANVDDFVELCQASLSFIGKEETDSPRPIGLSMRAFCHTAIYADVLASKRIQPPVFGAQSTDPKASMYTYKGLSKEEGLEMALWRPLIEGLAEGVRSTARNAVAGVGCLVQRGSILALRAILLRHGALFSTDQWIAILEQTLIPSIQAGAESDTSAVICITSESPSVSSVDFLVDSPPMPPAPDDPWLLKFESDMKSQSKRTLGSAEVMLEASFTDLRHGGDGNLRRAYLLARKGAPSATPSEQPFPDSWLATTSPSALGLLTDIASEFAVARGQEGRDRIWPIIANQYRLWCLGRESWGPCEALVRVACREIGRFSCRLGDMQEQERIGEDEVAAWASAAFDLSSDLIAQSADMEKDLRDRLFEVRKESFEGAEERRGGVRNRSIRTLYGNGRLKKVRTDRYQGGFEIQTNVITLDNGAALFQPQPMDKSSPPRPQRRAIRRNSTTSTRSADESIMSTSTMGGEPYWEDIVPGLKIRCVAIHCLHLSILTLLDSFVELVPKQVVSSLLGTLNSSRITAAAAVADEDVSMAFQEALLNDWGDGVAEVQLAIESAARLSHLHGSGMFFLTQEAGATRAIIRMLSTLYRGVSETNKNQSNWDRASFAEPHLVAVMKDVLDKFLVSEEKDGYLIDPNVWRNASESGGKVALYCTSFAPVVVEILRIIHAMSPPQFSKHKQDFFPKLCALIRVQSDEIRELVRDVLLQQVAPLLGMQDVGVEKSC